MSSQKTHNTPESPPVYPWHRITAKDRGFLYMHLANLIEGGVTAISALRSFLEKTDNPRLYQAVEDLRFFVESGDAFSIGMKKLPLVFPRAEIAIVEAGEQSGTMQRSFIRLAEELRAQEELKSVVRGALAYPSIIIVFLVGAVLVIMTYVIPNLMPLFEETDVDLPASTRSLVATSEFVTSYFWAIILAFLAMGLIARSVLSTRGGRETFEEFLMDMPLLGPVYKYYCIVRITSSLGLLFGAGISVLKALKLAGEAAGNVAYDRVMSDIADRVAAGKKLAPSFEEADPECRYFTRDFLQMLAAGEQTSTVDRVSETISAQYRREVENSLSVLTKFIEPAALLIAGAFVLWFALAIFSAVVKITETVG